MKIGWVIVAMQRPQLPQLVFRAWVPSGGVAQDLLSSQTYWYTSKAALSTIHHRIHAAERRERLDKIYYRLEVSKTKPTQFHIAVVTDAKDINATEDRDARQWIGTYATADELTAALEPYLQMEEGR